MKWTDPGPRATEAHPGLKKTLRPIRSCLFVEASYLTFRSQGEQIRFAKYACATPYSSVLALGQFGQKLAFLRLRLWCLCEADTGHEERHFSRYSTMQNQTTAELTALELALRQLNSSDLCSLVRNEQSAMTLNQVFESQSDQLQQLELMNNKLTLALKRVTAVAISVMYSSKKDQVSREFSHDELLAVATTAEPMHQNGVAQEAVYRAAWSLVQEQQNTDYTLH